MRILKIIAISFGVTSLSFTNISSSQAIPVEDILKISSLEAVSAQQLEQADSDHIAKSTVSRTEARGHFRLAQSSWPTGYYRANSNAAVYWLDTSKGSHCHVQNSSQMQMFGGFGQVRVTGTESFKSGTKFNGECAWPDESFLRRKSQAAVYGTYRGGACWVSSPQMMEAFGGFGRVSVIEDSSDIFAKRQNGGECVWPK